MSRVHDALRRAEQTGSFQPGQPGAGNANGGENGKVAYENGRGTATGQMLHPSLLADVVEIPFAPAPESHLLDLLKSHETPAEEFRTLRTRLNHLQTLQPLHTVIVTSPSPAEGKTFSAVNLALAESHLAETAVLLSDFDLRRPIVHSLFQLERVPGLTDYLTGQCTFPQALRRI